MAASRPRAWGGDAQPCVQFPTGLAIRHRRCELPGLTYFPPPGPPWPGMGLVELLGEGTSPTGLLGSCSGVPSIGLSVAIPAASG